MSSNVTLTFLWADLEDVAAVACWLWIVASCEMCLFEASA
jgi:hypothetical protein